MKNLINYIKSMCVDYKVNTRLDMLAGDGSPPSIYTRSIFLPNTEMKSSNMQSSNQMRNKQYQRIDNFALAFIH